MQTPEVVSSHGESAIDCQRRRLPLCVYRPTEGRCSCLIYDIPTHGFFTCPNQHMRLDIPNELKRPMPCLSRLFFHFQKCEKPKHPPGVGMLALMLIGSAACGFTNSAVSSHTSSVRIGKKKKRNFSFAKWWKDISNTTVTQRRLFSTWLSREWEGVLHLASAGDSSAHLPFRHMICII